MNKEKVDGFFEYFNKDGSLDYSEEWGVRTGVWEQFKIDGSIEFSSNYIKGREEE